jgi:hypothetical protein
MIEDRSGNYCHWLFRWLTTCTFAGLHSAGAGVPPKQLGRAFESRLGRATKCQLGGYSSELRLII